MSAVRAMCGHARCVWHVWETSKFQICTHIHSLHIACIACIAATQGVCRVKDIRPHSPGHARPALPPAALSNYYIDPETSQASEGTEMSPIGHRMPATLRFSATMKLKVEHACFVGNASMLMPRSSHHICTALGTRPDVRPHPSTSMSIGESSNVRSDRLAGVRSCNFDAPNSRLALGSKSTGPTRETPLTTKPSDEYESTTISLARPSVSWRFSVELFAAKADKPVCSPTERNLVATDSMQGAASDGERRASSILSHRNPPTHHRR